MSDFKFTVRIKVEPKSDQNPFIYQDLNKNSNLIFNERNLGYSKTLWKTHLHPMP